MYMNHDYSIYIRSLGYGGEKYKKLLSSIASQTIKPKKVVIVLPYGCNRPKEKLGYEKFEYCERGMLKQRIYAIDNADTDYVLLLDDDVEFAPDFVEKEFYTMRKAEAECCIANMKNYTNEKFSLKKMINSLLGHEVYTSRHDQYLYTINKSGGFVINKTVDTEHPVYSETGHGSNCLCKTEKIRAIHFEDEMWLEKSGYALPDDQVMFYKLYLYGTKIAVCMNAYFKHLDAASTNDGKRYLRIAQAKAGNYLIFWWRFIYRQKSKPKRYFTIIPTFSRIIIECFLYIVKYHNVAVIRSEVKGLLYGLKYIREKYKYNES